MSIADQLVENFARMVRREGGSLRVLSDDVARIEIGYAPGRDPECSDGACVLPHLELQDMMREWLSRRDPAATVVVHLVGPADA